MTGRIVVGVSGGGSNLRALAAAASRAELGGSIVLVFADRACPALEWAAEQGIETALVPGGDDETLAGTIAAASPDVVVLAGYMRVLGPRTLATAPNRILNTHPSLLPAFPGPHAVRDALVHGVQVTGCTIHLVDEVLDGGPIVAQEAVPVLPGDDVQTLHDRIRAVEHRLLPRAVALVLAGALSTGALSTEALSTETRHVRLDVDTAEARLPVPRRALLSVSDKSGLGPFAAALVTRGFELVSTGGTARALRAEGLPVTDIAAVTGVPEMLDGRVKTLHPNVHAGLLADRRRVDHRRQLVAGWLAPFELVVVNLYPFERAVGRPGLPYDELIEEIDIGGPSLVRAAAKNHASVTVVTSPARYPAVLEALDAFGTVPPGLRAALAVEAFRRTAAYDARIAEALPGRMAALGLDLPDDPGLPGASDPYPDSLTISLEKVETLRYGENPHQPAARYRRPGSAAATGPFAAEATSLQGKALSYNNILDAAAATALAGTLRGPGCVIVKHTNPCGVAERDDLAGAWAAALEADPVSAFGGVVALNGEVDEAVAEALASLFLEVVVAPGFARGARRTLAARSNLRLLVDERLSTSQAGGPADGHAPDPTGAIRSVGGAVLVSAPDVLPDDPATWKVVTRRGPTPLESADLDLAWRIARGVTSNAIVLVRDRRLVGIGAGQTSRVDAARQAVEKGRTILGAECLVGAVCASDAFFPFPDAVEVCLAAGVTAFVQPGGSIRDAEAIAAADAAGATMLTTGIRHFRH